MTLPSLVTLDDVVVTADLDRRARRSPDFEAEHRALTALISELALNPRNMLQKLAEVALDLCHADTAGISLLEGDFFRWEAVAGLAAAARGTTMPRHASPCGVCIDQNSVQLLRVPERCFPALRNQPRFVEALLVPFHDHDVPVGTVWIVSHTDERTFDSEDARVVGVLTTFASAAWQVWRTSEAAAHNEMRKNQFIATLGHELRNPLAALTTAAAVLKMRAGDDEGVRRSVDVIGRQCRHVSRLVDDLLDMARIENGKLLLNVQPVDLRAIVASAIEARRAELENRRQVLTVLLGSEPVVVEADPVRVVQVVSNLVDNAAKYTPDAGHITVAVSSEGGDAVVSVQDDGAGIPAERLTSIFEPFMQLAESRDQARGGLGLGLALVRRLAELHGGSVGVASDGPARGSRFTVRLPVHAMPAGRGQLPSATSVV